MLFLSIFLVWMCFTQSTSYRLWAGKQERPKESLKYRMAMPGCGMVVQNWRSDRNMAAVCLMVSVYSAGVWLLSLRPRVCSGTEGQASRTGRGCIPHHVRGVCCPSHHPQCFCCSPVAFLLHPCNPKLQRSAPSLKYGGWFALESAMRLQNQTPESELILLESHPFWLFLPQLFLFGLQGQLLLIHQVAKSQYLWLSEETQFLEGVLG